MFLLLLEFQAQDDLWMGLRIVTYSGLLYQDLVRSRASEVAGERLPAVLPVVLYNGTEAWTVAPEMGVLIVPVGRWLAPYQPAQRYHLLDLQRVAAEDLPYRNLLRAVTRLEQSRSPEDVERVVRALQRWLPRRGAEELRRGFVDWIRQIAERLAPAGALVPAIRTLEEAGCRWWNGWPSGPSSGCRKAVNKALRKAVPRALLRVLTSSGYCCAGWRRRASMPTPPPAWPTCWRRSPTRNAWPRSVTGWCVATLPPSSSPAWTPTHPPDTGTRVPAHSPAGNTLGSRASASVTRYRGGARGRSRTSAVAILLRAF